MSKSDFKQEKETSFARIVPDNKSNTNDQVDIIEAVMHYFYEDDSFSAIFEDFASKNCSIFDVETEENKLQYTTLHQEFVKLFEDRMEDFIESKGFTVLQFYEKIKHAYDDDPEGNISFFSQIMVATTDFDVFVRLMKDAKNEEELKASRK